MQNLVVIAFIFFASVVYGDFAANKYEGANTKSGQIEANMNEYMDLVMQDVGPWLVANGLDPMELPDIMEEFEYNPLFVTYHGQLYLTNGVISNLRQISRSGDSVMSYGYQLLRVRTGVSMKSLNFVFDYDAYVMNLGPSGWLEGTVENINIQADFIVDMYDFYLYMQGFEITSIGYIDVRVRGNILIDWMANVVIKIITTLFRSTLTEYISGKVYEIAQLTIDDINQLISANMRKKIIMEFLENVSKANKTI